MKSRTGHIHEIKLTPACFNLFSCQSQCPLQIKIKPRIQFTSCIELDTAKKMIDIHSIQIVPIDLTKIRESHSVPVDKSSTYPYFPGFGSMCCLSLHFIVLSISIEGKDSKSQCSYKKSIYYYTEIHLAYILFIFISYTNCRHIFICIFNIICTIIYFLLENS